MTLQEQVRIVHQARGHAAFRKGIVDNQRAAWEQANTGRIEAAKIAAEECTTAEAVLREMALQAYGADPTNKAPAPGVGIRVIQVLSYKPEDALAWAKAHDMALSLDKTAFEKIVRAQGFMPGVLIADQLTATIATDLSKFVEE